MQRYYTREMMDMFNVSRKQLRYYEEKGLLRDVLRDEKNGYRYYNAEHVRQMIAILGMKDLNLGTDKIREILYSESVLDVKEAMSDKLLEAKEEVDRSMEQYAKTMEVYNRIMEGFINSSSGAEVDENGNLRRYEVVNVQPRDAISLSYMETFDDPDDTFIRKAAEIQCMSDKVNVLDKLNVTYVFYDHFDTESNVFNNEVRLTKVTMAIRDRNKESDHYEHFQGFRGISTLHRGYITEGLQQTYHDLIEWGKAQGYKLKNESYEEWNLSFTMLNTFENWIVRIIIPIDE